MDIQIQISSLSLIPKTSASTRGLHHLYTFWLVGTGSCASVIGCCKPRLLFYFTRCGESFDNAGTFEESEEGKFWLNFPSSTKLRHNGLGQKVWSKTSLAKTSSNLTKILVQNWFRFNEIFGLRFVPVADAVNKRKWRYAFRCDFLVGWELKPRGAPLFRRSSVLGFCSEDTASNMEWLNDYCANRSNLYIYLLRTIFGRLIDSHRTNLLVSMFFNVYFKCITTAFPRFFKKG